MKTFSKLMLASVAALSFGAAHAITVIDNFSVSQGEVKDTTTSNNTGVATTSAFGGSSILGGYRDLYAYKTGVEDSASRGVSMIVESNALSFNSDSQQSGVGIVRWDGNGSVGTETSMNGLGLTQAIGAINAVGLGGADITELGGNIGFSITVTNADAGFPFTLQAFTNAGNYAEIRLLSTGIGSYFIPFAAFNAGLINPGNSVGLEPGVSVTTYGAGVNFASLGALQAIVNYPGTPVQDVDLTITLVQAVPEPASLALVGLALVGAGLARRKYAKRA